MPDHAMAAELNTTVAELAADAKSVARGLHRLVEGDLAGMFDGQSTTKVDWSGPGLVVDLSAVLQSPAFSSILVCAGAWLAQVVAAKDRQRIIVVDECWKAIRDAGFVAWGEETQKLSRRMGCSSSPSSSASPTWRPRPTTGPPRPNGPRGSSPRPRRR